MSSYFISLGTVTCLLSSIQLSKCCWQSTWTWQIWQAMSFLFWVGKLLFMFLTILVRSASNSSTSRLKKIYYLQNIPLVVVSFSPIFQILSARVFRYYNISEHILGHFGNLYVWLWYQQFLSVSHYHAIPVTFGMITFLYFLESSGYFRLCPGQNSMEVH